MRSCSVPPKVAVASLVWLWTVVFSDPAFAGSFDPQGNFTFDPNAVATEGFEAFVDSDPDAGPDSDAGGIQGLSSAQSVDALQGNRTAMVESSDWGWVIVPLAFPARSLSVSARLWTRRPNLDAVLVADFMTDLAGRSLASMFPTGRCTSDGWTELRSAPISIAGADLQRVAIAIQGSGEVDAVELVADGLYAPSKSCSGVFDPVCSRDQVCLAGGCRDGAQYVPPLPSEPERGRVVDWLYTRVQYLFGGHRTRSQYLPAALAGIDAMRSAKTAWAFWNGFATAVHRLHDWHTRTNGMIQTVGSLAHLNLCFIEGEADLSQAQWPSDPRYPDLVVSYTGTDHNLGLRAGDRLVAVDGIHPIAWARELGAVDWGYWQADDDRGSAEAAERMRGLIVAYARNFTVLRCDRASHACSEAPEVIQVDALARDAPDDADRVYCDNRPFYHLGQAGPSADVHWVGGGIFFGLLADSQSGEDIYGMVFDSLWGPTMNAQYQRYNELLKQTARGLILDHRSGNGGTVEPAETITQLVRDPLDIAIFPFDRPMADFEGPDTVQQGLDIFNRYKKYTNDPDRPATVFPDLTFTVGSSHADKQLPVALLVQRDGSASDYLAYGMKGAPKARIFGPHATAGAFSSFFNLNFWGGFGVQLASGDTVCVDGEARIGHGVEPDEVVLCKQSDLLQGRDTIYERALAWVRRELKP
jgi:hypothetical protein